MENTNRTITIEHEGQTETFVSNNEAETREIASQLAHMITRGTVITLSGDLGAGKTTFSQGFGSALGVTHTITSPTFVLMKVYLILGHNDITQLAHVDAYRLSSPEDAEAIGLDDYLKDTRTVTLIEWPERIAEIIPHNAYHVTLAYTKKDSA